MAIKGVVCKGEFWGIVRKTGLRLKGEDEKWTVFEVAGEAEKLVGEKKAMAEWLAERVYKQFGEKICYAQQWLKEEGKEKGGVSVDAMAGIGSKKGWIEIKDGEAGEALRQQAEDDVEKLGKVAVECEKWQSMTGKEAGEGRKVQRPKWIAYMIVGEERWWWRQRAVVDSGKRKPGGAWVWKLGEWAEEKEWSRRKRGRQRGSALTEEEKKKSHRKASKEWMERNPAKVEAGWKKQHQERKKEAAE